jgi:hypothetical protein
LNKTHALVYIFLCLSILTLPVYRVWSINENVAVAVDPPTSTVSVGLTFSVNVNITNVALLTAYQLDLYYLKLVLNCTAAVEGPFLGTGGSTFTNFNITNNYNSTHGRIEAYSSLLGFTSVNGSGVVLTVTFNAVGGGGTSLTLANTKLGDTAIPPNPIIHKDYSGTVTILNPPHDVAVTNVTSYKKIIGLGHCSNITVTVANPGGYGETFNVTAYANTTVIAKIVNITLFSGQLVVQNIVWNTTGFPYGSYTLKAVADTVPGETNTDNNNFTDGLVVVAGLGDLTGGTNNALDFVPDGRVDIVDVAVVAKFFGQKVPPAPGNVDVAGSILGVPDGKIDITDVATVAKQFGKHYTY